MNKTSSIFISVLKFVFIDALTHFTFAPTLHANELITPLLPTRNENLKKQVQQNSNRILACQDYYCLALDSTFFMNYEFQKNELRPYNTYHGNGFWLDNRIELSPTPELRLNTKIIAYKGSSSYGYSYNPQPLLFLGLTYENSPVTSPHYFSFRAGDLGLKTLGLGTMVDERPMNGVEINYSTRHTFFHALSNGTGSNRLNGDTYLFEAGLTGRTLYLGTIRFENESPNSFSGTFPKQYILGGTFLRENENFLGLELSHSLGAKGAYLKAHFEKNNSWGGYRLTPSIRYLEEGYGGYQTHFTQQDYTAYDLQGLKYSNPVNFLRHGDHLLNPSVALFFQKNLSEKSELYFEDEIGTFKYFSPSNTEFFNFVGLGIRHHPLLKRADYFDVSITNKYLTTLTTYIYPNSAPDRYRTAPTENDDQFRKPRFIKLFQIIARIKIEI